MIIMLIGILILLGFNTGLLLWVFFAHGATQRFLAEELPLMERRIKSHYLKMRI